jgi:hypothetical protein
VTNKVGEWVNVCKLSKGGKATLPGPKQVYRFVSEKSGKFTHDVLALAGGSYKPEGGVAVPMLKRQYAGVPTNVEESVAQDREHCLKQIGQLPPHLKLINKEVVDTFGRPPEFYQVEIADDLREEANSFARGYQRA